MKKLQLGNIIPEKEQNQIVSAKSSEETFYNPLLQRFLQRFNNPILERNPLIQGLSTQMKQIDKMDSIPTPTSVPVIENHIVSNLPIPSGKTFSQTFAEARKAALAGGSKTFKWVNPKTGELGVYGVELKGEKSIPKQETKQENKTNPVQSSSKVSKPEEGKPNSSKVTYIGKPLKEVEIIAKRPTKTPSEVSRRSEYEDNLRHPEILGYVAGNPYINSRFLINNKGKHEVVGFNYLLKNKIPFWKFNSRGFIDDGDISITKI